jgi:hypothetical protein
MRESLKHLHAVPILSDIRPLLSAPNFPIVIDPVTFQAPSPVYALKKAYIRAMFLRRAKISQFESSCDVQVLISFGSVFGVILFKKFEN